MAKIIQDLSLLDIAPPSINHDETVKNLIHAIDPELLSVSNDVAEVFIISRIDTLPEQVLDLLAWQWHVDFYELANNIDAKREMVKGSIEWHRHKGTSYAIIKALEMLGVEAKFTAWYDDPDNRDNPYTFAIDAKLTGNFWERVDWTKPTQTIRRAIIESKAARSYMSKLYVHYENQAENHTHIALGLSQGISHDIALKLNSGSKVDFNLAAGVAISQSIFHDIGFKHKDYLIDEKLKVHAVNSISQGVYHEVKLKYTNKGETLGKIAIKPNLTQGTYHIINKKE